MNNTLPGQPVPGAHAARPRMPAWLKRPVAHTGQKKTIESFLHDGLLHTVCVEAKCPNRSECFSKGTATFLILGDTCSRSCRFCNVNKGVPPVIDAGEPARLCEAAKKMNLRHIVVTSVTRDDLPDGGAEHFVRVVHELRKHMPGSSIELLIPDFNGNSDALAAVFESKPDILNHNIETVPRLYTAIRPQAQYERSLAVLKAASSGSAPLIAKSGLMVGLGETFDEVSATLKDIADTGCAIVTIGQYLQPSQKQVPVYEFVTPELFKAYEVAGTALGLQVFSGTFVRSSYRALEVFDSHDRC
jgi:lipoic acid synthetase